MEHQPYHPKDRQLPVSGEVEDHGGGPQIEQGIAEHGDAFLAYLELPDVSPAQTELLQRFLDSYIGSFDSMDALLNELTDVGECQVALDEVAKQWGFDGLASLDRAAIERIVHETWDIAKVGRQLHVFMK